MRQIDGVRGNFIHDDKEFFLLHFVDKQVEPAKDTLFCMQREMVEAYLFIFENYGREVILQKTGLKKLRKAFNLASQRLYGILMR